MTDDLKNRLEALGDRTAERSDAFERLTRVRDRKQRNRRRGGLVIGLAVALVGSLVAVTALRDGTTTVPRGSETPNTPVGWQPPDVLTVWPETPMDERVAADVQAQADAGDPDVQWRLDPEQVAERFGLEFLYWSDADAHSIEPFEDGLRAVLTPCEQAEACRPIGELQLWLRQPVRAGSGGIWSVAAVVSDQLTIGIPVADPDVALTGASSIGIDVELEPDSATSAHIGFAAANGCSGAGSGTPALSTGHHELTLPEPGPPTESCGSMGAGYVFAYVTDDTTIPVGDPLVEPAAIEYPWLTVVPFFLEMERAEATATATVSPEPPASPSPRMTNACPDTWVSDVSAFFRDGELFACIYWRSGITISVYLEVDDADANVLLELYEASGCEGTICSPEALVWSADDAVEGPDAVTYRIPPLDPGSYLLMMEGGDRILVDVR